MTPRHLIGRSGHLTARESSPRASPILIHSDLEILIFNPEIFSKP